MSKMKACLLFAILAVVVAVCYGCDPDGNNMPTCTGTSATKIRNFWDPTRYWVCQGNSAVSVECPIATGFDPKSSTCISWDNWVWYAPCGTV